MQKYFSSVVNVSSFALKVKLQVLKFEFFQIKFG